MNILVVEDEKNLADALVKIISDAGFRCEAVYDGKAGLVSCQSGLYDAAVMDVMLPLMDGFEVVSQLRREGNALPILMLTARTTTSDKVEGLDSGADDYMTKPFAPAELMARLRSLMRRRGEVQFERLEYGDITLGLETCELACGEKNIRLAYKEFAILKILMSNPDRITSKDTLIDKVWGVDSSAESNNVEAYISFLRKKLQFVRSNVKIVTQRKMGYHLEYEGDEQA